MDTKIPAWWMRSQQADPYNPGVAKIIGIFGLPLAEASRLIVKPIQRLYQSGKASALGGIKRKT